MATPTVEQYPDSSILRIAAEASARDNWALAFPVMPGTHESNSDALQVGGSRYATLIGHGGAAKIALDATDLYLHNRRIWRACSAERDANRVTLTGIWVDPEHRRRGLGSHAMTLFCKWCDALGITAKLEAARFAPRGEWRNALNDTRLIKWYKSFGFVSDPAYPALMTRTPTRP